MIMLIGVANRFNFLRLKFHLYSWIQLRSLRTRMRGLVVKDGTLAIEDVATPVVGNTDLLVKVEATAVNRADIIQRNGFYPPPPGASTILGLEVAGVVMETGNSCNKNFRVGDRVMGILNGGGYAEYASADEKVFTKIPDVMDFATAASLPEVWMTAYQLTHWLARLQPGERILIHAAGSGVGTAAVQLAKHANADVLVTAGSDEKLDKICQLGVDALINYKREKFEVAVLNATHGEGVDVILDCVAGSHVNQNMSCFAMDGRWIVYGFLGGVKVDEKLLLKLFKKRLQLTTSTLRTRPVQYIGQLVDAFDRHILPLIITGQFQPIVDSTFNWSDVNAAHARMEMNQNFGKIILTINN